MGEHCGKLVGKGWSSGPVSTVYSGSVVCVCVCVCV